MHNANCTCWNCPAIDLVGKVDFRSCGQSVEIHKNEGYIMAECKRRPELGLYDPMGITFEDCPEWIETPYGYILKNMRVCILGIDGYLGWTLALYLGKLGFDVSGVDNFSRRDWLRERGAHTIVPISRMTDRLHLAKELLGININFRQLDILKERDKLKEFLDEVKPEAIVHYAECPSAPYSMIDLDHATFVQNNNVMGTLGVLFTMRDTTPESSIIKLGTMGEYGCYDDQTEIFTKDRGWQLFRDLNDKDEVATRTKSNRTLQFVKPNAREEYDFTDENMYRLKNNRLDLLVTPNHRMFTLPHSNRTYRDLRVELPTDIFGLSRAYDIGLEWYGVNQDEYFILPPIEAKGRIKFVDAKQITMRTWLDFLGWYLSEGCVPERKDRPSSYRVCIKQKPTKALLLEASVSALCSELGLSYSKYYDEGDDIYQFTIWDKQLAIYLHSLGKTATKYVPSELKQCPADKLLLLLRSLILGDGWEHGRGYRYYTISRQLRDDVQEIALKCGYAATISNRMNGYQVNISVSTQAHVNHDNNKKNDSWEPYKGKVYCVNVGGDGIILVRRNGKPVWCGNTPLTGRPLFEGMFPADAVLQWDNREWSLGGEVTPRDPVSFYHVSKVQDTYNIYEACKYWWLRSYDVMQGVIYGVYTPQVSADPRLRTRLDIDEWFGTVINRFAAQAVIGFPLTMYGSGEQIRGFIGLEDAMQCMTRLIVHPPEPGQYDVVNQMSGFYSISELAHTVAKVASQEFGIPVTIQRVENPRVESDIHPFEPIFNKLPDQFGFKPVITLEAEIRRMLKLLTQPHIKARIEEKKHLILPRTWWSGDKKQVETLEVIKYEPSKAY